MGISLWREANAHELLSPNDDLLVERLDHGRPRWWLGLRPACRKVPDVLDRFGPVGGRPRPWVDRCGILHVETAHGGEESPLAHPARCHVESKLSPATLHPAAIDRNHRLIGLGDGSHDGRDSRVVETQEAARDGGRWPARFFSQGYQKLGPVVEVGDVLVTDRGVVELQGQSFRVTDRDVRPILRIDGREAYWDPTLEPRGRAFARLRKRFGKRHETAIRAELDRLASLAEEAGARALDTRRNVDRDLEWLFWHLRYHEGPAQVAARADRLPSETAMVIAAVRRVARSANIQLHPGWTSWDA